MNILGKLIKYLVGCEIKKHEFNEEIDEDEFHLKEVSNLRERKYMKCPKCGMRLNEIEYKDGKIDKCTTCDGVWLDAGELEVLLLNAKTATENIYRTLLKELY